MNNKAKYMWFATLGAILLMICLQACDLRSFVKVDAPKAVVDATHTEPPITLKNASAVREDWVFYVESNTKKLDQSIEDAEQTYAVIHQIVSVGIDTAGQASGGIPYGGLVFGALTGLTGLMLPQPKIVKKNNGN